LLSEKLGFNFEVGNTALFFSLFVLLFSDGCPKLAIPTKAKLLSNVKVQKQKRISHRQIIFVNKIAAQVHFTAC